MTHDNGIDASGAAGFTASDNSGPDPATLVAALDTIACGLVIATPDSRAVFVNRAAEAISQHHPVIVIDRRGGLVSAVGHDQPARLARLVQDAAEHGASGALSLPEVGGALLVLVTPLPHPAGAGQPGYALISLRSVGDGAAFGEASVSAMFRLSPVQTSLAMALYNGESVEGYAARRGVQVSTVRTHLSQIFQKTGVDSQRDLVRLLGMLPPLRVVQAGGRPSKPLSSE